MELIEIVDLEGNFTGEVMDKDEAHDKNLLHNEVAIFIINSNQEVLLQKRSANKRFDPNKWALCAGHVDYHERLIDAAKREVKEEIGIDLLDSDLHSFGEKDFILGDSNSHVNYYYYAIVNQNEEDFVIQKEELSEVKWFAISKVIEMLENHDPSIVFTKKRKHLFEYLKRTVRT